MLLAAARRLSGGQAGASGGGSLGQHRAAGPLLVRGPVRGGPASGTASPAGHAIWRTAPLTWHAGLTTATGRPGAAAASHAAATAAADTASSSSPPLGSAAAAGIDPATFVVVNFYHLVDVATPGKVRRAKSRELGGGTGNKSDERDTRATRTPLTLPPYLFHLQLHADHAAALSALDIAGRIYITPQGINAQFSGPAGDADAYVAWVRSTPGFAGITPSTEVAPGGGHLFPRLRLKLKPDLISLAGGCGRLPLTDPTVRAKPLKPDEWAAMLGLGGAGASGSTSASTSPPPSTPAPIVLDVRNGYEWDAGHFAGAARPLEDQFNETPTDVAPRVPVVLAGDDSEGDEGEGLSSSDPLPIPAHLANAPRDAPVMMYCTGGIRCDVYSAHLSAQGFTNLYTLEGGVHAYFREQGGAAPGWDGSLFVFDARMAVSPDGRTSSDAAVASGEAPLPAATPCALCGSPDAALPHLNCANIDCNRLFIACRACAARHTGCCCEACMAAPRLLRPAKVSGQYGTWASTVDAEDAETLAAAMAAGRGDGRRDRRRARAARLAASRGEHRVERARRKALMRAALAEREAQGGGQEEEDAEQASERLARLADLRARLGRGAGAVAG